VRRFELALPDTIAACQQALADGPDVKLVAGGTDLLPQMKTGMLKARRVVDLSQLPELKLVERLGDGGLRIGAGVSARTLELSHTVRDTCIALAESAGVVGSLQIRHLATLGGNLANAAPSADMAPPLLALEAQCVIQGPRGQRRVPAAEFFQGLRRTVLAPDELLVEIVIRRLTRGDVGAAMAEADLVIENTYRVPMVHQGYLEPHAAIADYDPHGRITNWSSTQGSFQTRGEVAGVLHIPEARVKVIPMECGGGFGGKIRALVEPLAVLLSKAAGKPLSLIMTRREELLAGMPAPAVIIRLKTGVKNDGTPVALEGETIVEAGAYSGALLTMSAVFLSSVYLWPVFDVVGYEVLINKPSVAAYRAPLAPRTHFAIDSQMDHIARKLGLDPTAYKLKYLQRGGDLMANNQEWAVNGGYECIQALADHALWRDLDAWRASGGKDGHGLRGTGLAIGGWVPNIQPTSATVRLDSDGTLAVVTGANDIAGTNMGLALIAAEAYGVDVERVRIITGDTDSLPLAGLSAGSKRTYTMGASVRDAAADARQQTFLIAARELEVAPDDLEIEGESVVVRGVPDRSIKLATIGKRSNTFGSPIPPVLGSASNAFLVQAPAFAAELARVEIDPDTGELTLHDFVVAQDVGKAINSLGIEGLTQGGAVQSLGFALTEGLQYDAQGRLTNPSLLDYRKLTAADLPNIETIVVEVPAPEGPFGARGVGEPPIVPAPAAIANAIEDATGLRLVELPLTPERIALGLAARNGANGSA
jgi:CO/xanthine dehydrogenase Mo-binding subunit